MCQKNYLGDLLNLAELLIHATQWLRRSGS